MTKSLIAYHGKQASKDRFLARVKAHREADELVAGIGWEDGRGCAVGCTLETYDHSKYPTLLGVPESIAYLEDAIFEGLANNGKDREHLAWPERFLAAIPVGADLRRVWPEMAVWLLTDEKYGVRQWAKDRPDVLAVVDEAARWWSTHDEPPAHGSADDWSERAARAAEAAWAARAARAAEAAWAAWAAEAAWVQKFNQEAERLLTSSLEDALWEIEKLLQGQAATVQA